MTKVIGISGISGAGKSLVTKTLGKKLNATMIFWDDFDEISESPDDLIKWYKLDRDYSAWNYDALYLMLRLVESMLLLANILIFLFI